MLVTRSTPGRPGDDRPRRAHGRRTGRNATGRQRGVQKLSMFVYPAKGQAPEKQKKDEQECYTWAKDQTGFDPLTTAAPNADSAGKAAKEQTAQATQGSAVKGAAKGAAAGALIGAAAGDAGKGAAVGAAAGGVGGRAGKKRAEKGAAAAGSNAAVADVEQEAGHVQESRRHVPRGPWLYVEQMTARQRRRGPIAASPNEAERLRHGLSIAWTDSRDGFRALEF